MTVLTTAIVNDAYRADGRNRHIAVANGVLISMTPVGGALATLCQVRRLHRLSGVNAAGGVGRSHQRMSRRRRSVTSAHVAAASVSHISVCRGGGRRDMR